jgi:hypothetical protein
MLEILGALARKAPSDPNAPTPAPRSSVPIEEARSLVQVFDAISKNLNQFEKDIGGFPSRGYVVTAEYQQQQADLREQLAALAAELAMTVQWAYAQVGGRPASRGMASRAGALRGGPGGGQGMAGARPGSLQPGASRPRVVPVPRTKAASALVRSHVLGAAMEVLLDQIYGEDEE